jgi:MoaA/NifB/PqqE/SkfB family radical SAM enzyme
MNTKERIMHGLKHPGGIIQLAGSMAERWFHLPKHAYPYTLQIHLDPVCNMKCFFCAYEGRQDKPIGFDINNLGKIKRAIQRAKYIALSSWGDPLCSPHLEDVLERIYSWNNTDHLVAIVTNGTRLTPRIAGLLSGHLADLTISLDASNHNTYNRDKAGGCWEKTMLVLRSFMEALPESNHYKVNLHFVAHGGNLYEIPEMIGVAKNLGIKRVSIDHFTVNTLDNMPLSLINVKNDYNGMVGLAYAIGQRLDVAVNARQFGIEKRQRTCLFPWMMCDVWADGRVAPCCCNGTFFLGNAYETSFEDVWFGKTYQAFRKNGSPQCDTCPMILPFDDPWGHVSPYLAEILKRDGND